jgi:AraC-like DNA-binding protein
MRTMIEIAEKTTKDHGAWRLTEVPPKPELAAVVGTLYYFRLASKDEARERRVIVMANPCIDLLINVGDPFTLETFGESQRVERGVTLHGPRPSTTFLRRDGDLVLVGARFKHGAAASLLPYPVKELEQRQVPFEDLVHENAKELFDQVAAGTSPAEQLNRLEAGLSKVIQRLKKPDPMVRKAVKLIAQHQGDLEVSALAEHLGVSRQTVKHKFDQHIGVSPKLYGKLRRFQSVLRRLANLNKPDWTKLAQESGYYDQAHLIREFNHFTGFSPQKFLNNLTRAEDLYLFDSADQTQFHLAGRFRALANA